jgi:uncharacterized membrane protein/protein-disulfide isomerase
MRKPNKQIVPLPFPYYGIPVVLLSLAGIADAVYLAVSHYRNFTDIGYASFCAISRAINCDTVSQSPYAIFLGVPVAVWGIIGYAVFFLLALRGFTERNGRRSGWSLLFLMGLFFSLLSILLAAVSTFFIHSYCIMCILSYAINLLLLFYCWLIRRRFQMPPLMESLRDDAADLWRHPAARSVSMAILMVIILTVVFFPPYWQLRAGAAPINLNSGTTADGHPWIGAPDPDLEIVEFTDYLCFQCRKMHFYLRNLVNRHPNRIRLVHRHFPMDREVNPLVKDVYHAGAAQLALLAIFAQEKGRFWEMNDALYQAVAKGGDIDLAVLAEKIGMEKTALSEAPTQIRSHRVKLIEDVWAGLKLEITGTPTYLVNGNKYVGQIPPEILRNFLE